MKQKSILILIFLLVSACGSGPDGDGDGVGADDDNCVEVVNAGQEDSDNDGIGDACDNCPSLAGEDQTDTDGDGVGDICDVCPRDRDSDQADGDGDGVGDDCDNCLNVANTDQSDKDQDTIGDLCDNCSTDANTDQSDTDEDTIGDVCDNCSTYANTDQKDDDKDAIGNDCDNCRVEPNPIQEDLDGDGYGDVCDSCIPGGAVNYSTVLYSKAPVGMQTEILGGTSADFDGDQIADIAVLNFLGGNGITIFKSQPDKELKFEKYDSANAGVMPHGIVALDVNGDGFPEIAVANAVDISVIQNKEGNPKRDLIFNSKKVLPVGGDVLKIKKGDFNNDEKIDIAVIASSPSRLGIFLNDGKGGFGAMIEIKDIVSTQLPLDIAVANFSGEGGDDIAVLFVGNEYVVFADLKEDGSAKAKKFSITPIEEGIYTQLDSGSIQQNSVFDLAFVSPQRTVEETLKPAEFAVHQNKNLVFSKYYSEKVEDAKTIRFIDIDFNGFADAVLGRYFWKHDDKKPTYEGGRVQIKTQLFPVNLLHNNINNERAAELISIEKNKIVVMEASCDE